MNLTTSQFPNNLPSNTQTYIMNRDHNPIVPHPELTITEITLPVRDNTPITLRIYRPKCHKESLPLLVYMHPGGYVTGGLETDDATLRQIALLGLVVVSIQYRLAPDFKFPTGFEDCFDVVRWVNFTFTSISRTNKCRLRQKRARRNSKLT